MNQDTLIKALKASLGGAADVFTAASDADFKRHLAYAARDYSRYRPRTLLGSITLVAGTSAYDPPAGLLNVKYSEWGRAERDKVALWDRTAIHDLPRLSYQNEQVRLFPAPTAAQISAFGADYKFFYFAAHVVDADSVTIPDGDELLLITRAQAEAAKELAARGITHPVGPWKNGLQSVPKPMTPAAIHEALMDTFERMMRGQAA